jgi:hypothetical protein
MPASVEYLGLGVVVALLEWELDVYVCLPDLVELKRAMGALERYADMVQFRVTVAEPAWVMLEATPQMVALANHWTAGLEGQARVQEARVVYRQWLRELREVVSALSGLVLAQGQVWSSSQHLFRVELVVEP